MRGANPQVQTVQKPVQLIFVLVLVPFVPVKTAASEEEAMETLREMLKQYRREMGWTQEELSRKWNYANDTIASWERGRRTPNAQEIPKIARLLGVTPDEIKRIILINKGTKSKSSGTRQKAKKGNADALASAFETWGELQKIYRNRTEFSKEFSYPRMLERAKSVIAVGMSLNAVALNYSREKLIDSLTTGETRYQLCFLDPDSAYCKAREDEESLPTDTISDLTRLNIKNMLTVKRGANVVKDGAGAHLEVMCYDMPPRFILYIVDDEFMTVQWYAYTRGEDTPTFVLKRQRSGGLFDFYSSAALYVLEHAQPIEE